MSPRREDPAETARWEAGKLPEVTDIQRLTIRLGDRVIVRCPERLSNEQADVVVARVRAVLRLPDDISVLVLPEGMSLEVAGEPPQEISR